MLAQILEDMWVEPEVLEALSEEQRRILFLKMREEQVRRWREREEKEEREGRQTTHSRPKKASSKRVSWLLGRDGDVSVSVIGEMDELRSSKLLKSLLNNRLQSDTMNGIQTVSLLSKGEAHRLESKQEIQLLRDNGSGTTHDASSEEEEVDSGSTEDDPRAPGEDSDVESGSAANNPKDCAPPYRPHFSSHGNRLPPRAQPSVTAKTRPQDRAAVCGQEDKPVSGGRVAELRKAFGAGSPAGDRAPAYAKPPVPIKPAHLRIMSTPSLH